MPLVAVYDACVLYPAPVRDFLLRLGRAGLVQVRWTNAILDECFRSILADRPDLSPAALARTRALMDAAFPSARVEDYDVLVPSLRLPDEDDRHVLAAALRAKAAIIVTFNLRDFPASALDPHGVSAVHPDDFTLERIAESSGAVQAVIARQAADLVRPPGTVDAVLARLQVCGLPRSVARLRADMGTV